MTLILLQFPGIIMSSKLVSVVGSQDLTNSLDVKQPMNTPNASALSSDEWSVLAMQIKTIKLKFWWMWLTVVVFQQDNHNLPPKFKPFFQPWLWNLKIYFGWICRSSSTSVGTTSNPTQQLKWYNENVVSLTLIVPVVSCLEGTGEVQLLISVPLAIISIKSDAEPD